jgi:hypothetical protein
MAEQKQQKIELVSAKIDTPQKPNQKQEQPEQQPKMNEILNKLRQIGDLPINTAINEPFLFKSAGQTTSKFFYGDYTNQLVFKPQEQIQPTQQKPQSRWYPADISSFLHTAEVLKNRQVLRLSQMGYKVKPTDEQFIYKKVLKSMANKGLVPPTKQVDDRSLLITLYKNNMLETKLTEKDLLDVKDAINNLSERDKRVFDSMKNYYTNLANNLDKLIYDAPSQQIAYPLSIINMPTPQGQIFDIQK